jgi:hypothetical protein
MHVFWGNLHVPNTHQCVVLLKPFNQGNRLRARLLGRCNGNHPMDDPAPGTRAMGSSRVRFHRFADLREEGWSDISGERCDRLLRVHEISEHRGTLVIAEPNRLLLLRDQDAYTGPMIMPQPRWRSRAQGHHAYILSGEWVPCLEVVANELCASVGPGESFG